jgi:hypothetical protein
MSKVARSARVGSRNRMEEIDADKTLTQAESGETYLIDWNSASALTITLPAMEDGAYFKFIFKTDFTANGTVVINSADNTAGDFAGSIFEQVTGGSNANSAVQLCGSHDILTISDDIDVGSWLEVYCDGSTWYWTGLLSVSAVGLAVFST